MVSAVNAPGSGGGQSRPKRCAENAYQWPVERIPLAPTVGSDLRKRRSAHSGYRHLAGKDEAGIQVLPDPLPAMTSENASRRIRGFFRRRCAMSRPLTWFSLLIMDILLQVSAQIPLCATPRSENDPKRTIDHPLGRPR
jgi:hypothetical protein